MLKQISLVNGKLTNLVSVYDRGLAYGDGFFETMLWGLVIKMVKILWSRILAKTFKKNKEGM